MVLRIIGSRERAYPFFFFFFSQRGAPLPILTNVDGMFLGGQNESLREGSVRPKRGKGGQGCVATIVVGNNVFYGGDVRRVENGWGGGVQGDARPYPYRLYSRNIMFGIRSCVMWKSCPHFPRSPPRLLYFPLVFPPSIRICDWMSRTLVVNIEPGRK